MKNYTMVINKDNPLDDKLKPKNLVNISNISLNFKNFYLESDAALNITLLFQEANKYNLNFVITDSYQTSNLEQDKYNELSTGLAFDISIKKNVENKIQEISETEFILNNAHKYGFILRNSNYNSNGSYPSNRFRYVGIQLATFMKKHNLSLEDLKILDEVSMEIKKIDNTININLNKNVNHISKLDMRLEDFLNNNGYSIDWLNDQIKNAKSKYNGVTRELIVEIANILTDTLSDKFNIVLPFSYGGGHITNPITRIDDNKNYDLKASVNPNWGYKFNEDEKIKYKNPNDNTIYTNYGPDCSGLLLSIFHLIGYSEFERNSKTIVNGYINENKNELIPPLGQVQFINPQITPNYPEIFEEYYNKFNSNVYLGKPGDLLIHSKGHVIIITEVDEINAQYIVVEAIGQAKGVRKNRYSLKQLMENQGYCLVNIEELIKNPEKISTKYHLDQYLNNMNLKQHQSLK